MDIITHGLTAGLVCKFTGRFQLKGAVVILSGLLPDIGEIPIQQELSSKYGTFLAVYDERTSDSAVAADHHVTWLYDILHSLCTPVFLILLGFCLYAYRQYFFSIAAGLITHIALDSFTHGKVWALKLVYPVSDNRIQILDDLVGNWWEWKPGLHFVNIYLPVFCLLIWLILLLFYFLSGRMIAKEPAGKE